MMRFTVSPEKRRKIQAALLLAILSASEGRRVSANVLAGNRFESGGFARNAESPAYGWHGDGPIVTTAKMGEQAMLAAEHLKVMMEDPELLEQSKLLAEQIMALVAEPKVQEWGKFFAESMENFAENPRLEEHGRLASNQLSAIMHDTSKLFVEQLESMMMDSKGEIQDFQQRAKVFSEKMEAIMEAPGIKERWTLIAENIAWIMRDREVRERAKAASEELMTMTADQDFMERVGLVAKQLEAIMENVEAIGAHLISQRIDGGPTLDPLSLAEVNRSSSRVSFIPPALRGPGAPLAQPHGHQSFSGIASGVSVQALKSAKGLRSMISRRGGPTRYSRASAPTMVADSNEVVSVGQREDPVVQAAVDLFILALRLGTCVLLVHHGLDKIQNLDGFSANVVAKFFGFLPGPPQFWTLSAAAAQIVGSGLLAAGLASRPVAASMTVTMIVAVVFHLLNTGAESFPFGVPVAHSYNFELAAMYVLVLSYFTVAGAGKYSVDQQIFGGELNLYKGLVDKVLGRGDK